MRLSVIGCGYLGAVHAAAMASLGHDVIGIDVDRERIAALAGGRAPFFEPGLPELLRDGLASGRLTFSADVRDAAGAAVHFLAVGTPQRQGASAADLSYVDSAVEALLPVLRPGDVVAGKSTVPVGTAARLADAVERTGAALTWNPEFLREGWAVHDTLTPDRIVVGVGTGDGGAPTPDGLRAAETLREVYARAVGEGTPWIVTDLATAELVKVAANAFLATKISFINAMAEIAEVTGSDVTTLADAIGHDDRIGRRFLGAGIGFGGGCLPKDLHVATRLHGLGAVVTVTDPAAIENARRVSPQLTYVHDRDEALRDADAVVLVTEWDQYRRELSPEHLATLTEGRVIVDGRNGLDAAAWRAAGFAYYGMGRP